MKTDPTVRATRIRTPATLQDIADNKTLASLEKVSDFAVRMNDFYGLDGQPKPLDDFLVPLIQQAIQVGRKSCGQNIYAVCGNDAMGVSAFFIIAPDVRTARRRLMAAEDF